MIDKNDRLKVPKRLYIMDYQLEPCKIDGISDARLNAFPFNTTNGKLVEYLCLDTLWHPASEEPKKVKNLLLETTYEYGKPIYHLIKYMPMVTMFVLGENGIKVLTYLVGSILMIYYQRKEVSNERA